LTGRRPNIVVITVESLSSDYLGAFGSQKSLTPKLDQLAKESFIFTNMLATGTRTVRGLEALSLAVPPTPGQSILRRPDSDHMVTLGSVLDKDGYKSDFMYGGYGYFDNMNDFFESNGYTIKDRMSIPKDEIFNETIWGVADEILFSQVLKSMDEHYANQEPTFEMVMTATNHRPWKFPEDRVSEPQGSRAGGVAYTDWAIADFIQRASQKPWFDNTVFVIVADHQAGVAGRTTLPVNRYRIPCIVYGPKLIQPGINNRLISQMDLAPTLLGMLGISYDAPFMGCDINKVPIGQERAFISTYQNLGYIKGDTLVMLGPRKDVTQYQIKDWMKSEYVQQTPDPTLTDEAITWYQSAYELYRAGLLKQTN
jgi:phosphoglycerol transferase MdoB-like AlkP superfamily enzyme